MAEFIPAISAFSAFDRLWGIFFILREMSERRTSRYLGIAAPSTSSGPAAMPYLD
jgi:hypothetical protein